LPQSVEHEHLLIQERAHSLPRLARKLTQSRAECQFSHRIGKKFAK
jgi:hypothetical protein